MATKIKNLYLYLALACFLGIVAIFIVDGYMGIHDTVYVTAGEQEQRIETDSWSKDNGIWWSVRTNWGEKVFFRYEIDNRQFSSYSADIEVSVWRSQEKVLDLLSEQIQIASFDSGQLEWVVDTSELEPAPSEQTYEYTVLIKRGEEERRIILYLGPYDLSKFPVPAR